ERGHLFSLPSGGCRSFTRGASAPRAALLARRSDAHGATAPPGTERHRAVSQGEQRVIATTPHQVAWVELGPALPDDDLPGVDELPAKPLDTEPLGAGVAAVPRT